MDEDYVTHMLQKYRLAVALAVLRNKPNNISVENYLTELQSKIRGSELDETLSNIDVDEEDFNLSDGLNSVSVDLNEENSNDSITILQNYDLAGFENEDQNSLADVLQILDNYEKNQELESTAAKETSTPNLSQINILETIQNQAVNKIINSNINTDTDIGYSKLHNDNLKAKIQSNLQKDFSFNETQNNINKDKTTTQAVINNINIYDSQETEIYTLHGIPEYNTHISQSQDNFVITKNFLINKQKENINQQNNIINDINVQDNTDTNAINDKEVKSKVYNFINEEISHDIGQGSSQESQSIQVHLKKKLKPIQYTENSEQENTNFNISQIQSMESETNILSNMEKHKIDLNQKFHKDFVFNQESQLFSLTSQESVISGKDLQKEYENLSLRNSKDKIPTETNISFDFGFLNTSHNSSASKIHNSNNSKKRNYSDLSQNSSQSELLNLNSKSNSKICHSSQNYSDSLFCVNTRDSLNEESHLNEDIENIQNTCEFNNILPSNNTEISTKVHSDSKIINMAKPEVSKNINDIEMEFEPKINKMNTLQNSIEKPYIEINSHLENEYQICSENAIKNSILKINQPTIPDSGPFIHSDGRQYQNSVNERNIVNENEEVNDRHELINERNTVNGRNVLIHERNAVNERIELTNERNTLNGGNVLINEGHKLNESTKLNERNTFESDSDAEIMKDLSDSQAEIIPFKVMEELNKIKLYLNKRNRIHSESHGTDSGYKSNSRESYLTASQSNLWLNQSSHCLFSYLSHCPLLVSTMEINYEVAKVLGLLIDRLHDDEKYPTFLEEMLEFIDKLLLNIYNGDFDDENVFLKNDESIDRLILLNKSQNIIKFTIEKITKLLENFHERLEKGSHVELENINTAENLCFIFHLLEVLLKKHTTNLSQTSQQSQDEKILKRSTLTEIWRKKWNLTQAEVYHKQEKRDVIVMCSDILNKIIVRSMENYSLVAFAALQCFNLLQS